MNKSPQGVGSQPANPVNSYVVRDQQGSPDTYRREHRGLERLIAAQGHTQTNW